MSIELAIGRQGGALLYHDFSLESVPICSRLVFVYLFKSIIQWVGDVGKSESEVGFQKFHHALHQCLTTI